jgi:hypothetical protein
LSDNLFQEIFIVPIAFSAFKTSFVKELVVAFSFKVIFVAIKATAQFDG